ncbi:MAG: SDR family NAD(P)-dependent oxidoreductase [Clostridiales bacterium]|nr:SDR family NAD(P)-dependent oxidoreductase [Clostridiales bacterium]
MNIAIVTGASSGIGREFALQLDSRGGLDEIWIAARRRDRLENLENTMKTKVRIIEEDLSKDDAYSSLETCLAESQARIKILVNAAGAGKFGSVESQNLSDIISMTDVNIKALTAVTRVCLPYMADGSGIINMASVSAYPVLPYLAVYSASKAYVLHFSQALAYEVKSRGISVTAVCPYWVESEFIPLAENTPDGKCINNFAFITYPFPIVKKALCDNEMGKTASLCGLIPKAVRCLSKKLPVCCQAAVWNAVRLLRCC